MKEKVTKKLLVEVAKQLFATKGIENTTMNDIAESSEKGWRTLYEYFKSKEEIYYAVIESELDKLTEKHIEIVTQKITSQEKLIELINNHLGMIGETVKKNGNLETGIYRNFMMVEKVRKRFDSVELELFQNVLAEGKRNEEFDIDNIKLTANFWYYFIKGLEGGDQSEFATAETLHKQELAIDLRVDEIIHHTALSKNIPNLP